MKQIFWRKTKTIKTIISGLPRSGTSMTMKMLDAGGIPPLTDHIRVLFMRREMDEILASQAKMLKNRGEEIKIDNETMAVMYTKHRNHIEDWINSQPNL